MQAGVFRLAVYIDDTGAHQRGHEAAFDDVRVVLDAATSVGKHEPKFALGADETMLPQCIDHQRRHWHDTLSGFGFETPHLVEAIGTLAHVDFATLEINVTPTQPAQFASTQAGKDRGQK